MSEEDASWRDMVSGATSLGITSVELRAAPGFKYCRPIYIHEQSGIDLIDYQVFIELNSMNFDFEHAQTNGEDIRFTDEYGFLLDYWIEEWDSVNEKAKVWVEVPFIPANSSVVIYMYYGNPSASSASDGEETFGFFIDRSICENCARKNSARKNGDSKPIAFFQLISRDI